MDLYRRVNTIKVVFEKTAQRPTALEIHQWVSNTLKLTVDHIEALQLLGPENAVYIKLISKSIYDKVLQQHEGTVQTQFASGVLSTATVGPAGYDTVQVRVFNLPIELSNDKIKQTLSQYGTVFTITNELWSTGYIFPVHNGIRQVKMNVTKVIPSNLLVAGKRAYVTYLGQEPTCFACGMSGHVKQDCKHKVTSLRPLPQRRSPLLMSDLLKSDDAIHNSNTITSPPVNPTPLNSISIDTSNAVSNASPTNNTPSVTLSSDQLADTPMDESVPPLTRSTSWADDVDQAQKRQKLSDKTTPALTVPPLPPHDISEVNTSSCTFADNRPLSITGQLEVQDMPQSAHPSPQPLVIDSTPPLTDPLQSVSSHAGTNSTHISFNKGNAPPDTHPKRRHKTFPTHIDNPPPAEVMDV